MQESLRQLLRTYVVFRRCDVINDGLSSIHIIAESE
jgi:hypothetical protein